MKNQKKHERKFRRDWEEVKKTLANKRGVDEWCTRTGAKEVIDDLTKQEFEVITNVLGHLYSINGKFSTKQTFRKHAREVEEFLKGKTIKRVEWWGRFDEQLSPRIKFTDGSFFEIIDLLRIPCGILYDFGTAEEEKAKIRRIRGS